jgi:hypothetical protein
MVLGLIALALLGLFPVLQSSSATTTGFTVSELEVRRDLLRRELNSLESDVALYASLDYVETRATTQLGMVQPEHRLFVTVPQAAPSLDRLPSRYEPREDLASTSGEPWWQGVADLLDWS